MVETNSDSYNADELVAPEWLNAQFFEEVLSNHEKAPELKIVDVKISPASGKGDHYASIMFRGNVTYTTKSGNFSKSLIVKTMPEQEGHKKEMLEKSNLFVTEIAMYTRVLPEFERILRQTGDNTKLYVPCIYQSLEPRQVMIFEDLVPQGYEVMRDREPTIEELKAPYSKLAKWHAVSMHIMREDPDFLKELTHGMFDMPDILKNPFMTSGMRSFIELLERVPELSKYKPFFLKIESEYLDRMKDLMLEYRENRQENGYYVLCHGDFHLRNMMFKHNKANGSFEDCMLLDFQISNLCPITIDLIYSIYMLMGSEHRQNNHKELIDFYFSVFVDTLKKIGFKGKLPNLVEFWKQISNHKFYDFFLVSTFLPMILTLKKDRSTEFSEILQENDVRKKMYCLDAYIEDVKQLLSRFEKQGYLE